MEKWRGFATFLREATARQSRLPKIGTMKTINVVSRKFGKYTNKGNVISTIKLLSKNREGGVLLLNKETIDVLKMKHPTGKAVSEDNKLYGLLPTVENIIFNVINDSMVLEAAKITQGDSGPSGMDAESWRRI